ncbi:MAG: hypothetical protein RJA83_770 [Pseudomonadota bacterium]
MYKPQTMNEPQILVARKLDEITTPNSPIVEMIAPERAIFLYVSFFMLITNYRPLLA